MTFRVVVDTNTIISALFWDGLPWEVYSAAAAEKYELLTSEALINELQVVLNRPKFAPALEKIQRTAQDIVEAHRETAEIVLPVAIPSDVIRDPKDRIVLACAVGGKASYIISGDKDLLILKTFQDIAILKASDFLPMLS